MPADATIHKARQALARGDKHRALEILRSSLGNYGYSIELFQAYGDVLHANGNAYQAGSFYFVSCPQPSDAQLSCINTFLHKHKSCNISQIIYTLPKVARFERLTMYPDFVQTRLRSLGAEEILLSSQSTKPGLLTAIGCIVFLCAAASLALIGLLTVIKWMFE